MATESIVLDPGEITGVGTTTYADVVLADAPSLYWRLGEPSGTTAEDATANNRDGTYVDTPTLGVAGALAGDADTAVDFNGTSEYVDSGYNPFINGTVQTFEGWAWRDNTTNLDELFGSSAASNHCSLRIDAAATFVRFYSSTAGASVDWSTAWPGTAQWVHWALVFDETANTAELFINGQSQTSKAATTAYNASPGNFRAGLSAASGTQGWDGKLDEIAVYGGFALSAAQVLTHYNAGLGSFAATTSDHVELDINSGAIRVKEQGVDWGDAAVTNYMAEQARGESPVDFRIPNRQINIPLVISASGTVSFDQARQKLQAKTALLQREGGWIKRETSTAGAVYADVVAATLHLSGGWMQAHKEVETEATLALEALPDFYGPETTLADHTETSAAELVFTEAGVGGDLPGRVRLVVDNDSTTDQRGLIWSFRSRHYASASTAATKYEAEALTAIDTATKPALSGASGGTVVQQAGVSQIWTPVLGTNIAGTQFMTHTGTNRVFARVYSTSGYAVECRLVWDVGDLVFPNENRAWKFPGASQFYVADLGEVHLDKAPVGTHRWQGQIQARGLIGGENFQVDKVWIVNADEAMGVLKAPPVLTTTNETRIARDPFDHSAGALATKVAPFGGTWTGAGDADDFQMDLANTRAARTAAVSDSAITNGRYARLGTGVATSVGVQAAVVLPALPTATAALVRAGVFARYTDVNNWLMAVHDYECVLWFTGYYYCRSYHRLIKRVAGTVTTIAEGLRNSTLGYSSAPGNWGGGTWDMRLAVDTAGRAAMYFVELGTPQLTVTDSDLATGGPLATGGYGIYDANTGPTTLTRGFNDFDVTAPASSQTTSDAVIYASRSAQLGWDGCYRQDIGGTAYGPVSQVIGDLPRIPPAGPEGRTTEVFVKASRGDFETIPDAGIDDVSAQAYYRPSWLFIPE